MSLPVASIEGNITLELAAEPSSVLVSWVDTEVPSGVSIIHYNVKYEEKKQLTPVGVVPVGVVHASPPEEVSLMVQGLKGHQHYIFRVSVVVEETDGGVYEFGGSEEGLEIFVPGMCAGFSLPPSHSCPSFPLASFSFFPQPFIFSSPALPLLS